MAKMICALPTYQRFADVSKDRLFHLNSWRYKKLQNIQEEINVFLYLLLVMSKWCSNHVCSSGFLFASNSRYCTTNPVGAIRPVGALGGSIPISKRSEFSACWSTNCGGKGCSPGSSVITLLRVPCLFEILQE